MKELTLEMLLAIFEEIFGRSLFWLMVIVFILVTAAFIYVLIRERKPEANRLVKSGLWAPVGAVIGITFVFFITNSGLSDMGGPIDVIVLILIGSAGAVGLSILVYTIRSLFSD